MWKAVAVVLSALLLAVPAAAAAPGLPLGLPSLRETRTTDVLAPGVSYTRIARGAPSPTDGWTVDVAVLADRGEAQDLANRLRAAGYAPQLEALPGPPDRRGKLGYRVRAGHFPARSDADAHAAALRAAGFTVRGAVFTAEDGGTTSGPWVVHVLSVERRAYRRVQAALANDAVSDREPLSALARREGALAAINGGYFVIGAADGTPGDLAGSSILDGEFVSEAVDGRTDLLLGPGAPAVGALSDAQWTIASDGATRVLDGNNRRPGAIRGCGGSGGDTPTEAPLHDITCTDSSELIRLTSVFGAPTESGDGVEAVLDKFGRVTTLRSPRGDLIPPGGSVLAGTGDAAECCERGLLPLVRGLSVVNGGPRLLRNGRPAITAAAEGFDHPGDPGFYYAFALRRNPRTLAGVTRDGRLLLVAVDGRAPGYSAGLSFEEGAAVMRALGAEDAVNLDGGGSTTMTVRRTVVTRPSDAAGEHPIADAILIGPQDDHAALTRR